MEEAPNGLCSDHARGVTPRYRGLTQPRTRCTKCWELYRETNPEGSAKPTLEVTGSEIPEPDAIAFLEQQGYVVHKPRPPLALTYDDLTVKGKDRVKFAIVSCTHFGSKFQQLTALNEFCSYAVDQGIDFFVHGGDIEDGPFKRHRNPQDVFLHDFNAIRDYTVEHLPRGAPWRIITGNHDDWWTLDGGPNMGEAIAEKRDDITFLGNSLGYILLGDATIEVIHANDGGSKQPSLKLRNHLESLSPALKPNVCLLGNYHKFCVASHRNVLGIQLPSFQAQTPWMAGKSIVSEVAGVIVEVGTTTKGLAGSVKFELVTTYEPREDDF